MFASGENEKITPTWDDVRGATSYNVYWSTSLNGPEYKISHVKMPFIHTGLKMAGDTTIPLRQKMSMVKV
ncbi:MAG: hypothetical protein B5M53_03850 [Candidatus Cloacimonas sp. 4484_209]|nr:MAG: hypothetical protein B5M53_03850 [Candidatus Cloacimonas sp. 4484_209]